MRHAFAFAGILSIALLSACVVRGESRAESARKSEWSVKADMVDVCCCKPSCPCLFGSPATLGFCEGVALIDFNKAHYGDVRLDSVRVVAVYRSGTWIKFYVSDRASEKQTAAALNLIPTFEKFLAVKNVLESTNAPISVKRRRDTIKVSTRDSRFEIKVMKGKNGKPMQIKNFPAPGFPGPEFHDHTQYKSVLLKHEGGENSFEHTGTNGFSARIDVDSDSAH